MKKKIILEYIQVLIFAVFFSAIYFWTDQWAFPIIGLIIALLGLWAKFRSFFNHNFQKLAHFIGRIQSAILLGAIYLVILLPLAFIRRIFNKKPSPKTSFFINRSHRFMPRDFEKMW